MPQTAANSVKFYTLSSMPNIMKNGSFLNLTEEDNDNKAGLYFCDGSGWKYLMNVDTEIQSAIVYNNVMYFYNTPQAPNPTFDSDSDSDPNLGDYVFSVELPEWLLEVVGGDGIKVTGLDTVSVDLAPFATKGSTATPHADSINMLKIDTNHKLSLSDTWKCGEYDDQIHKHLLHLHSANLKYIHVLKVEIPDGVTVTPVSALDLNPTPSSPEYVKHSGNNNYYRLVGCSPSATSIAESEIAIQSTAGFERLYIKNTANQIVEFRPAGRLNTVYNATFKNPALTQSNSTCVWEIPYSDIIDAGIGVSGAVVFLRDTSGKQLIPDVVFDGPNQKVIITIYSTTNIGAGEYTAIVFGSNYNDTH